MAAYLARGQRELTVNLPADEPFRSRVARAAATAIAAFARGDRRGRRAMFLTTIDDRPATDHPFAAFLQDAGFARGGLGLHLPRPAGSGRDDAEATDEADQTDTGEPDAHIEPDAPSTERGHA
jgi:ATP-dependent Lhr-like helicase